MVVLGFLAEKITQQNKTHDPSMASPCFASIALMEASKTPNLGVRPAEGHRYQGPQNTNMKGFPKHKQVVQGLSGMFQGYVGVFLESTDKQAHGWQWKTSSK